MGRAALHSLKTSINSSSCSTSLRSGRQPLRRGIGADLDGFGEVAVALRNKVHSRPFVLHTSQIAEGRTASVQPDQRRVGHPEAVVSFGWSRLRPVASTLRTANEATPIVLVLRVILNLQESQIPQLNICTPRAKSQTIGAIWRMFQRDQRVGRDCSVPLAWRATTAPGNHWGRSAYTLRMSRPAARGPG